MLIANAAGQLIARRVFEPNIVNDRLSTCLDDCEPECPCSECALGVGDILIVTRTVNIQAKRCLDGEVVASLNGATFAEATYEFNGDIVSDGKPFGYNFQWVSGGPASGTVPCCDFSFGEFECVSITLDAPYPPGTPSTCIAQAVAETGLFDLPNGSGASGRVTYVCSPAPRWDFPGRNLSVGENAGDCLDVDAVFETLNTPDPACPSLEYVVTEDIWSLSVIKAGTAP